jgi:hypothetical protein
LDLAVYKSFKSKLADIFAASPGDLNRLNFISTVAPAFKQSFQSPAVLAGWGKSGIWPFKPGVVLDSSAVLGAELRSKYIASAQSEPEAKDSRAPMLDIDDGTAQSSSPSSSSSSSSSASSPAVSSAAAVIPSQLEPAGDDDERPLVAPGERITLLSLSSRVAPILTAGKRKRKTRELISGADLTSESHRHSIADKPRKPSKRDQSATLWAPGMPPPPKPARGKRKAKPKSAGSKKAKSASTQSKPAKPTLKARNSRIVEDFLPAPEALRESKASAPASAPPASAPESDGVSVGDCPACGLACLESQRPRVCDGCQQLWHSTCAGVQQRSRTRQQAFTCPHCLEAQQAELEAARQSKRRRVASD